jgi:hypothetical protein
MVMTGSATLFSSSLSSVMVGTDGLYQEGGDQLSVSGGVEYAHDPYGCGGALELHVTPLDMFAYMLEPRKKKRARKIGGKKNEGRARVANPPKLR